MNSKPIRVLACFSSQSGTSESLAERFCNDLNEKTGDAEISIVQNIGNFEEPETLQKLEEYEIVIFFISSYGEGEPCDDGVTFFETLKRCGTKLKQYSLFGCGNTYYDKYQAAAIALKQLLDANGCILFGEFGEGNEANNSILDDYDAWSFDYVPVLSRLLNVPLKEVSEYVPVYQIQEQSGANAQTPVADRPPYQELKPFVTNIDLATVRKYGSNYVHFDLELHRDKSRLKYQAGDHVGIYPKNSKADVDEMLRILGLNKTVPFKVVPFNRMGSSRWVGKVFHSYREFLTHNVEINGVLSRKLIQDLMGYFIRESATELRGELETLIGSQEVFREKVIDQKLTLVKLFQTLGIARGTHYETIPVSFVLEYLGPLRPRLFSVSSSECAEPDRVGVMLKLVKDADSSFNGVCSKTIEDVISDPGGDAAANRLLIYVTKSKFKLPSTLSRPMLFIGAGSGIAPFRGFLQEICAQPYKLRQVTKIVVYFGLRSLTDEHYLYRESLNQFQTILGDRLLLRLAVSGNTTGTTGTTSATKQYVQDLLREDAAAVVDQLVGENGHVYVCGDAGGLSRGVRKVLVDVLGAARGSLKSGDQYVQYMQSMGRYREDVW